jgi:hypothetical protein
MAIENNQTKNVTLKTYYVHIIRVISYLVTIGHDLNSRLKPYLTRSQVTGWNPLEGSTKSSYGKLRLGGTLSTSNSRKG